MGYLYTNTSFFSVFPFFRFSVFPFYVLRFTWYVFPFPLMLMHMLMHMLYAHAHPHSKTKHQRHFHRHLFTLRFFVFFFSAFIHFLISSTRRFFVFRSSSFQKNETNSCQFQFIRVINTPSITSTSQRHLYFLQSRIPLFYESTKKKINKKNKK